MERPAESIPNGPKVTIDGEKLRIDLQGEPPYLVFEGDALVATAEGVFVDHWKKVD